MDLCGIGATQEEAYADFERKAAIYFDEMEKLGKSILETDILQNSIVQVDCLGEVIEK